MVTGIQLFVGGMVILCLALLLGILLRMQRLEKERLAKIEADRQKSLQED